MFFGCLPCCEQEQTCATSGDVFGAISKANTRTNFTAEIAMSGYELRGANNSVYSTVAAFSGEETSFYDSSDGVDKVIFDMGQVTSTQVARIGQNTLEIHARPYVAGVGLPFSGYNFHLTFDFYEVPQPGVPPSPPFYDSYARHFLNKSIWPNIVFSERVCEGLATRVGQEFRGLLPVQNDQKSIIEIRPYLQGDKTGVTLVSASEAAAINTDDGIYSVAVPQDQQPQFFDRYSGLVFSGNKSTEAVNALPLSVSFSSEYSMTLDGIGYGIYTMFGTVTFSLTITVMSVEYQQDGASVPLATIQTPETVLTTAGSEQLVLVP